MIAPGTRTSTHWVYYLARVRATTGAVLSLLQYARFMLLLALLASASALTACGAPERSSETAVIASGADLESGNPLVTVHPLSRQLQRYALFTTLVRLDSALNPVPYAARSWHWDSDNAGDAGHVGGQAHRSLTMNLATNLKWHDGVPFTAEDVAFTIEAAGDPELGSPRRGDVSIIAGVEVQGTHTIRIRFHDRQADLPYVLAELPIVPKHLLDTVPRTRWRSNRFAFEPVGSGPFRFSSRIAGRRWEFVRNDDFPTELGGPPKLQTLVVAVVDEAATKFAGLVSGELDIAGVSPLMAHLVSADSTLSLRTPPVLFSQVLAFNTTREPLNEELVRKAISLVIDRTRLIQAAVAGYATPALGAIPPGLPFSPDSKPQSVNMQANKALADSMLTVAGWVRSSESKVRTKNGATLHLTLLTVGSGDMALEQLVQSDLADMGIDVTIRVVELTSFLSIMRSADKLKAEFDIAITGIPGDLGLGYLSAMFESSQKGGALDYTGFHTRALDALLVSARNADEGNRKQAWQLVEDELNRSMPVAWLYHAQGVQGLSRRMKNVVMDLRGELVSVADWVRE